MGNAGEHIDYALLLDGLKAEREQGITIDVAYRYFSTNNRKFIIADTPGHEQYTRNMITGGSTANLAIILVDARTGVIARLAICISGIPAGNQTRSSCSQQNGPGRFLQRSLRQDCCRL